MKKIFSILICVLLVCASCLPHVYADEDTHIDAAYYFSTDHVYYIRFDATVNGVGDAFRVEYVEKEQTTPSELEEDAITLFNGERLEIVLHFPDKVADIALYDLVRQDGTHMQQSVQSDTFHSYYMSNSWDAVERDVFCIHPTGTLIDGYRVAVGSKWKLSFKQRTDPRDPYLREHVTLAAEGIELTKDGDEYVFESVGDGSISLCLLGIPYATAKVSVLEKQEFQKQMILYAPAYNFLTALYLARWLTPLSLLISLPIALGYTVYEYIQVFIS